MLGRERFTTEDCRLTGLEAADDPIVCALEDCGKAPWRERDCLAATPPLEAEEAVGAMRDEGKFTVLVGDLGLGLTKPVSLTVAPFRGWGRLATVEDVGRAGLVVAAGALVAGLVAAGLAATGLEAAGLEAAGFFGVDVFITWVGSAGWSEAELCSTSTDLSGLVLGSSVTAPAVSSAIGSLLKAEPLRSKSSGDPTLRGWLLAVESTSLLILRLDKLDSPLWSRCKPSRPSFSTATKLLRTLERGRGPSVEMLEPGE